VNDAVLEIVGAGKSYRDYSSTWWRAAGWLTGKPSHFFDNWVLRDISLAVRRGEALGVVGRNGAGKSTLLKLVAGTLTATEGSVVTRGRVSAILELGMGFNPEFSARDNARHACGLQGYSRAAIDQMLGEANATSRERESAQVNLLGETTVREPALPVVDEWTVPDRLSHEFDAIGFYLSAHPLDEFATTLADGVASEVAALDPVIADAAEHWRIERMNVMDRLILRLALYEFVHQPETPAKVIINEALELARTFSGDESVRFINGVLDAVRRKLQRE